MAENKKSFVLYSDSQGLINQLPDDIAGRLFKHIYAYVNDENPISDELLLNIAFEPIKMQLKRDLEKWEQTLEGRSKAGKASAEAKRLAKLSEQNITNSTNVDFVQQTSTNSTDNVNVNVNDNVNDNVNEIKENNIVFFDAEIIEFSFDDFWSLYPNKTNKKKAQEKFSKLTKEQKQKIELHLPYFINNKPFKDYNHPHAITYLNQERYNDEIQIINTNLIPTQNEFNELTKQIRESGQRI